MVGVFLFLTVVVLACLLKFWRASPMSAVAAVVVIIPALFVFAWFTVIFYRRLTAHKFAQATRLLDRLDRRINLLEDPDGSGGGGGSRGDGCPRSSTDPPESIATGEKIETHLVMPV